MSVEKKTRDIDGHTYEIQTFGARQGMQVLIALTRFLGPTLGSMAGGGLDQDINLGAIGRALEQFAATAKDEDFNLVAEAFASRTKIHLVATTKAGRQSVVVGLDWDTHFAGNLTGLLAWMAWCVRENFADFFDGKAGMMKLATAVGAPIPLPGSSGSESPKA